MQQPPPEVPVAVETRDAANILGTYKRTSFHPRAGKGAKLVDADGKVYWDLLAGIAVNALGYRHPRLVKALTRGGERASSTSRISSTTRRRGFSPSASRSSPACRASSSATAARRRSRPR